MEWFELYDELLKTARKEMGGISKDGEELFNKMFYYGIHDWFVTELENYRVEEHNKMADK